MDKVKGFEKHATEGKQSEDRAMDLWVKADVHMLPFEGCFLFCTK